MSCFTYTSTMNLSGQGRVISSTRDVEAVSPLVGELLEPPVHPPEDVAGGVKGGDHPGHQPVVVVQVQSPGRGALQPDINTN